MDGYLGLYMYMCRRLSLLVGTGNTDVSQQPSGKKLHYDALSVKSHTDPDIHCCRKDIIPACSKLVSQNNFPDNTKYQNILYYLHPFFTIDAFFHQSRRQPAS